MSQINELLNNILTIHKRIDITNNIVNYIKTTKIVVESKTMIIAAVNNSFASGTQEYNKCSKTGLDPYFIIVDKQDKSEKQISDVIDLISPHNIGFSNWYSSDVKTKKNKIILNNPSLNKNNDTILNIATFLYNVGYSNAAQGNWEIPCDGSLESQINKPKDWNLIGIKYEKYANSTEAYIPFKTMLLKNIPNKINPLLKTIKWLTNEKTTKSFFAFDLVSSANGFKTTSNSKSLNKQYIKHGLAILGTGSTATIFGCNPIGCFVEKGKNVIAKVAKNNADARLGLYLEYCLYDDLIKIGFPVLPIYDVGMNYEFLLKEQIDANGFGNKIQSPNSNQIESLKNIFYQSNRYTVLTGIPLSLKPENLWWNGTEWILINATPLFNASKPNYAYTLNPENFEEYYNEYWVLKKGDNALPQKYTLNWANQLIDNLTDVLSFFNNDINLNEYETLIEKLVTTILEYPKNQNRKICKILSKGINVDKRIIEYLECHKIPIIKTASTLQSGYPSGMPKTEIFNQMIKDSELGNIQEYLNNEEYTINRENKDLVDEFVTEINALCDLIVDSYDFIVNFKGSRKHIVDAGLAGVTLYTSGAYGEIAACFRNNKVELPTTQPSPLPIPPLTLCKQDHIDKMVDLNKLYFSNYKLPKAKKKIHIYRTVSINSEYDAIKIFDDMPINTIIEDRAPQSTSIKYGTFASSSPGYDVILKIEIPPGMPLLYIGCISNVQGEHEVLLPPGMAYTLLKKIKNSPKHPYPNHDTCLVRCTHCTADKQFSMSIPPRLLEIGDNRRFSQQQDKIVAKNRIYSNYARFYNNNLVQDYDEYLIKDVFDHPIIRKRFRIMTWNVSEWKNDNGSNVQTEILDVIRKIKPDVLGLQKIPHIFPYLDSIFNSQNVDLKQGAICTINHSGKQISTAIAIKKSITLTNNFTFDLGHNVCGVCALMNIQSENVAIITFQLASTSEHRKNNISKLLDFINLKIKSHGYNSIAIMGDFSSYRKDDYDATQINALKELNQTEWPNIFESTKILEDNGYVDAFVKWTQDIPINTTDTGGRMDFIYVNKEWNLGFEVKAYTYYGKSTTHLPIIIDFIEM